jgi:hypothetical protein
MPIPRLARLLRASSRSGPETTYTETRKAGSTGAMRKATGNRWPRRPRALPTPRGSARSNGSTAPGKPVKDGRAVSAPRKPVRALPLPGASHPEALGAATAEKAFLSLADAFASWGAARCICI